MIVFVDTDPPSFTGRLHEDPWNLNVLEPGLLLYLRWVCLLTGSSEKQKAQWIATATGWRDRAAVFLPWARPGARRS